MRADREHPRELSCPHCGYNVAIIPGNRCPECGGVFDRNALLRWRTQHADGPRLWRAVTIILAVPVAFGSLIVLSGFALSMLGAIFAAPALAIMVLLCFAATLMASEELISSLHARQVGFAWQRHRLRIAVIVMSVASQIIVLAAAVLLAIIVAGS